MPARNAPSGGGATQLSIKAGPQGPLFKMEQETDLPRLNTPTSGRMRMRGAPAPAWMRDSTADPRTRRGTRFDALLTVEPKKVVAEPGGGSGDGTTSLDTPPAVVGKTGPLKPRAERKRRQPPNPPAGFGSSIPSMRGGGWTPRWEALQAPVSVPVPPLEAREAVQMSRFKREPHPSGLQLTVDPQISHQPHEKVAATTIRSPHDIPTNNERVHYGFSPRRTRFAQTTMSIAAGSPR